MDNLYKSKKKANATSINTSDVPHPNVSPYFRKHLKQKYVFENVIK
jgi:hypothetical protein